METLQVVLVVEFLKKKNIKSKFLTLNCREQLWIRNPKEQRFKQKRKKEKRKKNDYTETHKTYKRGKKWKV